MAGGWAIVKPAVPRLDTTIGWKRCRNLWATGFQPVGAPDAEA
jgi:hypothetical protein